MRCIGKITPSKLLSNFGNTIKSQASYLPDIGLKKSLWCRFCQNFILSRILKTGVLSWCNSNESFHYQSGYIFGFYIAIGVKHVGYTSHRSFVLMVRTNGIEHIVNIWSNFFGPGHSGFLHRESLSPVFDIISIESLLKYFLTALKLVKSHIKSWSVVERHQWSL